MVAPRSNNAIEVFQAVVAKDGSGMYKTISEAVSAAPNYSKTSYNIKIKAGLYEERVVVGEEKQHLVFIGDGAARTIINGQRSVASGLSLEETATVAGLGVHQAVALRNAADYFAFYMCNFNGYQDTLYAHHGHQFFRNCNIFDSTDFIFGAAGVVFQDCNIYVHSADTNSTSHRETVITAQGKEASTIGSSGISFHKCNIQGAPDLSLNSPLKTFLGRPWRDEATVVYMESILSSIIDPQGWELFVGNPSPSSSIFYGEYHNTGAGSSTKGRATWANPGGSMTCLQAQNFSVRNLIQGDT